MKEEELNEFKNISRSLMECEGDGGFAHYNREEQQEYFRMLKIICGKVKMFDKIYKIQQDAFETGECACVETLDLIYSIEH